MVVNLNFSSLKLEATTIMRFILISPLLTLNSHGLPVLLCDSDMLVVVVTVVAAVVVAAVVVVAVASFTELKLGANDCWACCVSYEIDTAHGISQRYNSSRDLDLKQTQII